MDVEVAALQRCRRPGEARDDQIRGWRPHLIWFRPDPDSGGGEDGTAASLWRRSDLYLRERYEGRERERKEKGGRRSGTLGVAPWNSGSHRRRSEAGQGSGARERCSGR